MFYLALSLFIIISLLLRNFIIIPSLVHANYNA